MEFDERIVAVGVVALLVGTAVGAGGLALVAPGGGAADGGDGGDGNATPSAPARPGPVDNDSIVGQRENPELRTFESKAAFQQYVRQSESGGYVGFGGVRGRFDAGAPRVETDAGGAGAGGDGAAPTRSRSAPTDKTGSEPGRYSETNVQERGIQEPDILKTDGKTAFYAPRRGGRYRGSASSGTKVVDVSSPASPSVLGSIDTSGRMFLTGDTLVTITNDAVYGYDVSDPKNPTRKWETGLNGGVVAARLVNGTAYLVVRKGVSVDQPCPVRPLGVDGPRVDCTEVYHPIGEASAEVTYTTVRMDPTTGEVGDTVSIVGSRHNAATYVSDNAVYLTYVRRTSRTDLLTNYLLKNETDLLSDRAMARLRQLQEYNISDRARGVELRVILRDWFQQLDANDRREAREQLRKGFREYVEAHKREVTTTGVVKVGIGDGLSVEATGEVPGVPLNQFSMDEADGHLRIATTVQGYRTESENDLYVLDSNLSITGRVTGMSDGQRIYSVRYVGDTAYVVTFRQVDPFHVIDLSDPSSPEQLGKVKLPGFSRYLHPIGEDRILGIGEEDGNVKATVFDVSTPSEPKVSDSKVLDDSWSAISRTHHAFLQDPKHEVFFLPGRRGGYVFSYADGLTLEKRVRTPGPATRAMYVDNYMYVFSSGGLVVLNESDWSRTASLVFEGAEPEPEPDPERRPKVGLDWEYENGTLTVTHAGGDALDGERLVLRCEDGAIDVEDDRYEAGDTVVETDQCEPGDGAFLIWSAPESGRAVVIGQFEVPSEDS